MRGTGGVLRLRDVERTDAGEFRCGAENAAGRAEAVAVLAVQQAPTVLLQPAGSVVSRIGTDLTITCIATGFPHPTLAWKKMGR